MNANELIVTNKLLLITNLQLIPTWLRKGFKIEQGKHAL